MPEDFKIATTNRLFIAITQMGQCNEKGRAVLARGYRGKMIAQPDKPITTLILPLISSMLEMTRVDDPEQMKSELAALKRYVAGLEITPPKTAG